MAKKTVGYVHLEWTCPSCGNRNGGLEEKCTSCGSPQPADVQFEQAAQEKLVSDERLISRAKAGPDIHCPFCGTRNLAGSVKCQQCLADLDEAAARARGQMLGAHRVEAAPDIACSFCQTVNPASALKCSNCGASLQKPAAPVEQRPRPRSTTRPPARLRAAIIAIVGLIVVAICVLVILTTRTEDLTGRVIGASWNRTVVLEALVPVEHREWYDEIPADAVLGSCQQELRRTLNEPAPGSFEVCGTPYTVDTGTGVGEVVQDCVYEVYEDYCEYTVDEWQAIGERTLSGEDLLPQWPEVALEGGQRLGERQEEYRVFFDIDGRQVTYRTSDPGRFAEFAQGSEWLLEVNTFDAVMNASPAD